MKVAEKFPTVCETYFNYGYIHTKDGKPPILSIVEDVEMRDALFMDVTARPSLYDKIPGYSEFLRDLTLTLIQRMVEGVDFAKIQDYCMIVGWKFDYIKGLLQGDQNFVSGILDLSSATMVLQRETLVTMRGIKAALMDVAKVMGEIKSVLKLLNTPK